MKHAGSSPPPPLSLSFVCVRVRVRARRNAKVKGVADTRRRSEVKFTSSPPAIMKCNFIK